MYLNRVSLCEVILDVSEKSFNLTCDIISDAHVFESSFGLG